MIGRRGDGRRPTCEAAAHHLSRTNNGIYECGTLSQRAVQRHRHQGRSCCDGYPIPPPPYSPAEYIALERSAASKHEYIDGIIVAKPGASHEHSLIAANVNGELRAALRRQPCEVHGSDLRVSVPAGALHTYPDVTVVCGEPAFEDAAADTLTNPTVIFEVLSPTTEAYDRGEKFARYRRLPSLRTYVLVSQDRPRVEWYTRGESGWLLHEASGLDGAVELAALDCTHALAEIYAKVPFAAGTASI